MFTTLPAHIVAAAALAAAYCAASIAKGQEESGLQFNSIQITASSGGDGEVDQAAIASGISSIAVGGPGGIFTSNFMGGVDPNNRSQLFQLLTNESIRKELQLTDDQYQGVQQIMQENGKRMGEQVRQAMAQGSSGAVKLDLTEVMRTQREQAETAIEEILLPEQLKRIRQLAYQIEIARDGLGESLVNGRLGREVGVYDQQKQHLSDRAQAIERELRAAIAKAHTVARAKLFAELAPDQRKAAEELVGSFFQYEENHFKELFRQQREKVEEPKKARESGRK